MVCPALIPTDECSWECIHLPRPQLLGQMTSAGWSTMSFRKAGTSIGCPCNLTRNNPKLLATRWRKAIHQRSLAMGPWVGVLQAWRTIRKGLIAESMINLPLRYRWRKVKQRRSLAICPWIAVLQAGRAIGKALKAESMVNLPLRGRWRYGTDVGNLDTFADLIAPSAPENLHAWPHISFLRQCVADQSIAGPDNKANESTASPRSHAPLQDDTKCPWPAGAWATALALGCRALQKTSSQTEDNFDCASISCSDLLKNFISKIKHNFRGIECDD